MKMTQFALSVPLRIATNAYRIKRQRVLYTIGKSTVIVSSWVHHKSAWLFKFKGDRRKIISSQSGPYSYTLYHLENLIQQGKTYSVWTPRKASVTRYSFPCFTLFQLYGWSWIYTYSMFFKSNRTVFLFWERRYLFLSWILLLSCNIEYTQFETWS